jgi:hypothetical protein
MGRRYVIEHCTSALQKENEEIIYRTYITDTLQTISKNVDPIGRQGYIEKRYWDVIHPKPEDTRTGGEIIEHFKDKLGKLGGEPG